MHAAINFDSSSPADHKIDLNHEQPYPYNYFSLIFHHIREPVVSTTHHPQQNCLQSQSILPTNVTWRPLCHRNYDRCWQRVVLLERWRCLSDNECEIDPRTTSATIWEGQFGQSLALYNTLDARMHGTHALLYMWRFNQTLKRNHLGPII